MLIVLEGLDGAGKSTQVKRLKAYLERRCEALRYIHFPRYDALVYGDLIGRFLRGDFGSVESVHPQLVALLFAEDRHGAAVDVLIVGERKRAALVCSFQILGEGVHGSILSHCALSCSASDASE